MVVLVPRLTRPLGFPPVGECWQDTVLSLPEPVAGDWRDVFASKEIAGTDAVPVANLFAELPFAVLVSGGASV